MFSCCKTLPSRYSRYLHAQTKPSKHVSSRLFAGCSHTTEKSCDKATRHFSNYSKYRDLLKPWSSIPSYISFVTWHALTCEDRQEKKQEALGSARPRGSKLTTSQARQGGFPQCQPAALFLGSHITILLNSTKINLKYAVIQELGHYLVH